MPPHDIIEILVEAMYLIVVILVFPIYFYKKFFKAMFGKITTRRKTISAIIWIMYSFAILSKYIFDFHMNRYSRLVAMVTLGAMFLLFKVIK